MLKLLSTIFKTPLIFNTSSAPGSRNAFKTLIIFK